MRDCLSKSEIDNLLSGSANKDFIEVALQHLDTCPECRDAVVRSPGFERAADLLRSRLGAVSECLSYEQLASYLDGALVGTKHLVAENHLSECPVCEADLNRLREAESFALLREHRVLKPIRPVRPRIFTTRNLFGVGLAAGTCAVLCLLMLHKSPVPEDRVAQRAPSMTRTEPRHTSQVPERSGAKPAQSSGEAKRPSRPASGLRDGSYIVSTESGTVRSASGKLLALPSEITSAIRRKLSTGRASEKPVVIAMLPDSDVLRDADEPTGLEPVPASPRSTNVLDTRPALAWSGPERVESFTVGIYTTDGDKVWDAEIADRTCRVGTPLARGTTYLWRVGSRVGGETFYSKATPFRVLSDEESAVVLRMEKQYPNSHLIIGTTYEQYGLYGEALIEFDTFAKQNPSSAVARRLLQGLKDSMQEVPR